MKKIAIYGRGGLGHEVAAAIRNGRVKDSEDWEIIGYFDDRDFSDSHSDRLCGDWLGGIDRLNDWTGPIGVILCFGNPRTRLAVAAKVKNPLVEFPNCIASDYRVSDPASYLIGKGNIIQGGCNVTTNISIGDFNLFNGSVVLGHDVKIGDGNVFMPGCRISGEVSIGDSNLIGAMSFVKQGLRIGSDITLSPLSALLTKPKDGQTYIGNPAKKFRFD
ncbi:MAG: serine acetyltransferase [Muribaculaceae bacterium]|nr:serine acetyltransferase [Muribaculaceae bacterium]